MLKYFLILLTFCSYPLFAGNHYPLILEKDSYYPGGNFYHDENLSDFSFLLKTDWANDNETIYVWKGIERRNAAALTLSNTKILSSIQIEVGIFILTSDNSGVKLRLIGNDATIKSETPIPLDPSEISQTSMYKKGDNLYLLASGNLYEFGEELTREKIRLIDKYVFEVERSSSDPNTVVYLQNQSGVGFLCVFDKRDTSKKSSLVEISDNNKIIVSQDKIITISNPNFVNESFIQLYDKNNLQLKRSRWIESKPELIDITQFGDMSIFAYISRADDNITIHISLSDEIINGTEEEVVPISASVIEAMKLKIINDKIYTVFKNAILILTPEGDVSAYDYIPVSETNNQANIQVSQNKMILKDKKGSLILNVNENKYWYIYRYSDVSLIYIIPLFFFIIMVIAIQFYRHQKRVFRELLDLPSAGVVMIFDASGRLIRANKKALNLIDYQRGMPQNKIFSYYLNRENTKAIAEMIKTAMKIKEDKTDRIDIEIEDSIKEWVCSVIILRNVAGMFRGLVFTGIDITEQLERKRLTNWAQLAHDMQTNLSTIRLNAEQIETDDNPNNLSRRTKITHQVNVIMQRVRDIVTVGRSNKLEISEVNASEICISARNEFDETLFPDVDFQLEIEHFQINCDQQKLIRAVRNAIENAIKALPNKQGNITISCKKSGRNVTFSVRDNGSGMDEKTKLKMMQPYFTTAENKGGFGIGTMIMQHVVEMHEGRIKIVSEEGKGTEIIFEIPLILKK